MRQQLQFSIKSGLIYLLLLTTSSIYAQSDNVPPILLDFSISEFCIDTSNDTIDVVFLAQVADSLSGVAVVELLYLTPNNLQSGTGMNLISGTSVNGVYEVVVPYDNWDVAGVYTYGLFTRDNLNNSLLLNVNLRELQGAGYVDSLKVINANSDAIDPTLLDFQISETCIDVSSASIDVTFTADVSDNMSGVNQVGLNYLTPSGLQSSANMPLVSGDSLNGTYELTLNYDVTDLGGIYTYGLYAWDNFNNSVNFNVYNRDLLAAGFVDSLKIINTNSDFNAPTLVNFEISETCIDVINGSTDVTFTVEVTDDLSGVNNVNLSHLTPNGSQTGINMPLASGSDLDGIYEWTITYDNTYVAGVYNYGLYIIDDFNNSVLYNVYNRDLLTAGYVDSLDYLIPNVELYSNVLILPNINTGVVFENEIGECYKMTIDNNGDIVSTIISCSLVNANMTVEKSHIFISSSDSPLVLSSPNGEEWKIEIDDLGNINLSSFVDNGFIQSTVKGGDLFLDKSSHCASNGIIVKSPNGSCWLIELDASNLIHGRVISCP